MYTVKPLKALIIALIATLALIITTPADAKSEITNYGFNDFYGQAGDLNYILGRLYEAGSETAREQRQLQQATTSYLGAVADWQKAWALVRDQRAKKQTRRVRWRLARLIEKKQRARAAKRAADERLDEARADYDHALSVQRHLSDRWSSEWSEEKRRMDKLFFLTAAGGANTYRVTLSWRTMQPDRDRSQNWWYYDYLIDRGDDFNLRPIITITGAPCWARPSVVCNHTQGSIRPDDSFLDEWKTFAAIVAARYPETRAIEIWNEPNAEKFWGPNPSPANYLKVLKAGYQGVKSSRPEMRVILGGLSPAAESDWGKFLSQLYNLGAEQYSDALGLHPYPRSTPLVSDSLAQIDRAQATLNRVGSSDRIWITEYGISTNGPKGSSYVVSPSEQAFDLAAFYQGAEARGVPTLIIHKLLVDPESDWIWENGLSLIKSSGQPKPAYCALAALRDGRSC